MKNTHPRLKKALKIVLITLCSLILLVGAILLGVHLLTPVIYDDFFDNVTAEYETVGLDDGLVPQGFDYLEDKDAYLQCGYMADESASRIYVIPEGSENEALYVSLLSPDGTPYTGHTGGITAYGDFVWLANDGEGDENCVWVLSLSELLATPNGGEITLGKRFSTENRAAYCMADGKYLWVGEFYREEDYPTAPSHTFTVANGEEHHAIVCAYPLDSTTEYGVASDLTPEMVLSVTGQIQGFDMTENGGFVLSASFGLSTSLLRVYAPIDKDAPDAKLAINGEDVPVYFLDEDLLLDTIEAPPMSEEIVVRDDRLYVVFESACDKYIFGNFTRGRDVYSIPLE